ncbi:DotI/IcmL family type IV secretion protein [Legionella yabuuchiae]|uniref:DotI/IcmL family type IV secretion protein n=1 Tax=Legionella yabuuchiae TaxID=376727 RepID=UPI0010543AB3|nr:DotI/IcmL family type IV secretion protein [Legionella yabuuchiae]
MKKTILYLAIMGLLSSPLYADETIAQSNPPQPEVVKPGVKQEGLPNPELQPASTTPQPQADVRPQPMSCEYKIPPEKTDISDSLIKSWAEFATVKAFELDAPTLDQQMAVLEKCFTKQGWAGFQTALEKSGNLQAIRSQNLIVSSQVDGKTVVNPAKENQWKVTIPLEVVYQNQQQRLTQLLSVDVLIGRTVTGDLGIMQMIAIPRVAGEAKTAPAAEIDVSKTPTETKAQEATQQE